MTASSLPLLSLLAAIVLAPFAVKWYLRQRHMPGQKASNELRIVSAAAVGPQQRIVTVEAGPASARVWLVLGVTAGSITTLHTAPADAPAVDGTHSQDAARGAQPVGQTGNGFASRLAHFREALR